MPYTPTNWENLPSTATPITAERLNKIEQALANLYEEATAFIEFTAGSGTGVIYRVGRVCQMNVTVIGVSLSEPLFAIPDGYKPAINFDTPLINSETGMVVGELAFDRVTDVVTFNGTSATLGNPCRVTVTYLCDE